MVLRAARGQVTTPIGVVIGLIGSPASSSRCRASGCSLGLGVLALLGYRAYAGLADRHRNLERLYGFSRTLSSSPDLDRSWPTCWRRPGNSCTPSAPPPRSSTRRAASSRVCGWRATRSPGRRTARDGRRPLAAGAGHRRGDPAAAAADHARARGAALAGHLRAARRHRRPAARRDGRHRRARRRRPARRRPQLRGSTTCPCSRRWPTTPARPAERRADRPAPPRGPARRPHRAAEPRAPAAAADRRAGGRRGPAQPPVPR